MSYIHNPKTIKSGIICAIPHTGICPNMCPDCFFQNERSFLEPLKKNLPNMPTLKEAAGRIIRVSDGHDSIIDQEMVMEACLKYKDKFYNTACYRGTDRKRIKQKDMTALLERFDAPVVVTVNPSKMTDKSFHKLDPIPRNLMFVRFRINTWNTGLAARAIDYYTALKVPVILTFMAYHTEKLPEGHEGFYTYKTRTKNPYWVINLDKSLEMVKDYVANEYVYTCGKNSNSFPCHRCGNCLREYYATKERLRQ